MQTNSGFISDEVAYAGTSKRACKSAGQNEIPSKSLLITFIIFQLTKLGSWV